eukprot:748288-Hanusia_phi.AAC.1
MKQTHSHCSHKSCVASPLLLFSPATVGLNIVSQPLRGSSSLPAAPSEALRSPPQATAVAQSLLSALCVPIMLWSRISRLQAGGADSASVKGSLSPVTDPQLLQQLTARSLSPLLPQAHARERIVPARLPRPSE